MYDRRALALMLATILCAVVRPASAQVLYGSIVGNVTDASNASVPGAKVTVTHTQTNQSRETTTNDSGGFSFANATPGNYDVVVSKEGFQTFSSKGVLVLTNSAVRVDAILGVGAVSESVEVTGQAAALQTDRADVHSETTAQVLENIPVSGRSYQSLLVTTPGVTQPTFFQTGGINNPSRSMQMTVNGTPTTGVVVRIDGVSATNQWQQQLQAYTPAIEAIEVVNTVTNSFDAEQGMAGGASVSIQIKSGTNQMHGSAFEYLNNKAIRARGFFLPATQDKLPDNKNVFGGTVGGPIKKNKLFYFAGWEANVQHAKGAGPYAVQTGPTSFFLTLPNAAVRSGDFSQTGTAIYDPATGNANGTGRTPFAGGIIPQSRLSPLVTGKFLPLLPLPQFNQSANNYFTIANYRSTFHKIDSKVNWNASDKLGVNARFSYLPDSEYTSGVFPGSTLNALSLGTEGSANVLSSAIGATYIVNPSFVVDGVWGFTRQHTTQKPPGAYVCYGQQLGIPNACQLPNTRDFTLPRIDITGWSSYGNTVNTSSVFDYLDPQWQAVANGGYSKGSHNIRFGYDMHRLAINHYEVTTSYMTFTGGQTALSGGSSPNNYNSYADFLLGNINTRFNGIDNPPLNGNADPARPLTLRSWEFGLYARDQWQVSRKITTSIGVRWEYYPVPTRADRGIERYDFAAKKMLFCGLGGTPGNCGVQVSPKLFAPRLGLAYRPAEGFVARAGFSLNWQQENMYRAALRTYPAEIDSSLSPANSYGSVGNISDGLTVISPVDVRSGSINLPAGIGFSTLPLNYVRGYVMSWNASLQKALSHDFTAQVSYVGNRVNHQVTVQNQNFGQVGGGGASQPFFAQGITAAVNLYLPMTTTNYHSMQATLSRRLANGISVNAAYTFSKAISSFAGLIPIPQYFKLNKGLQATDTPHKFTLSAVTEAPFGKGKRFLNNGGIPAAILGGWQANWLLAAYSGAPFTVSAATASLNAPGSTQQADLVKPSVAIPGKVGPSSAYFDPLAFAPVTQARFGTAGFNILRGPRMVDLDTSLFRNFALAERFKLQVRVEAFNITNTPHFGIPSGLSVSSLQLNTDGSIKNLNGFGVITSTNNSSRDYDERYFRMGLRLSF